MDTITLFCTVLCLSFFCFPLFQTACQGEVSNGALQRGQKCALWECARIRLGTQMLGVQGWDLW